MCPPSVLCAIRLVEFRYVQSDGTAHWLEHVHGSQMQINKLNIKAFTKNDVLRYFPHQKCKWEY